MAKVRSYREMAKHYDEKVPIIAKRWKEITPKKKDAFAEGVARILGVTPDRIGRADDWAKGVERAVAYFEDSIKGKGTKLAENYKTAMLTE